MNSRRILIVGTTHPIQMRARDAESSVCDAFRQQLIKWCEDEDVDAIAEEMNQRAREEGDMCSNMTVPEEVAETLDLEYMECDDNPSVLPSEQTALAAFWADKNLSEELNLRNAKRENHWMRKISSWQYRNVVFVCGSDHVNSFQCKLNNNGFETKTLATEWNGK